MFPVITTFSMLFAIINYFPYLYQYNFIYEKLLYLQEINKSMKWFLQSMFMFITEPLSSAWFSGGPTTEASDQSPGRCLRAVSYANLWRGQCPDSPASENQWTPGMIMLFVGHSDKDFYRLLTLIYPHPPIHPTPPPPLKNVLNMYISCINTNIEMNF